MRTKIKKTGGLPVMVSGHAEPVMIPRTIRGVRRRGLTSARAGKIVPHFAAALLREDSVERARIVVDIAMEEAVRPLKNAVMVETGAYFVPFTAFERFHGSHEAFDKSYMGIKEREADAAPVPLFDGVTYDKTDEFWKTMGIHHPDGTTIPNAAYLEAYNVLVNFLYRKRSKNLTERLRHDTTLARGFWQDPAVWHIKPDFDQAMMEGEIQLTFTQPQATVRGLGLSTVVPPGTPATNLSVKESTGSTVVYAEGWEVEGREHTPGSLEARLGIKKGAGTGQPDIYADLNASGIKISLANIELAKQITAWARKRDQYKHLTEEHVIDLLMQGVRVPPEQLQEPMLLDQKRTIFGMNERYAMDGASLDQSVTTGRTRVGLNFWLPPMNTGGVVMVISTIVPEAMWERKRDPFLYKTAGSELPNAMIDFADQQKVDIVRNSYLDVLHDTPDEIFGYAPLNHDWKQDHVMLGGKYFRPDPTTFVEDRQEFWTVETENPSLNTSWYLVPDDLSHSVFKYDEDDPFEIQTIGEISVVGLTQFGGVFEEDNGSYEAVADDVTQEQIDLEE